LQVDALKIACIEQNRDIFRFLNVT